MRKRCEEAESVSTILPRIIFQEKYDHNKNLDKTHPNFGRYVSILGPNAQFSHAPTIIKCWRRLCPSYNPQDNIKISDPAPMIDGGYAHMPVQRTKDYSSHNEDMHAIGKKLLNICSSSC